MKKRRRKNSESDRTSISMKFGGIIGTTIGAVSTITGDVFNSKTMKYIDNAFKKSPEFVTSKAKKVSNSKIVTYWKGIIKGLPEYDKLVKAGKIEEMEKILDTLVKQGESIQAMHKAVEQLKAENAALVESKKKLKKVIEKNKEKDSNKDIPIYAALFSEGIYQNYIDQTAGDYLHVLIGEGAKSKVIDSAFGIGHRLKTGHDLSGFLEMFKEEGVDGAATWFQHMFADLMSPEGIPLPGASYLYRFMENTFGVSEKWFVNWTCVSATDIISAGFSLLILARIHKIDSEKKKINRLTGLTFVQLVLLIVAEANPFYLATIPLQGLMIKHEWKKWQIRKIKARLVQIDSINNNAKNVLESIELMLN